MSLQAGSSIGAYELVGPLLPSTFSADPDRLARFTREAQTPVRTDQPTTHRYVLIQNWIAEFSRPR
jgi:hypothetical protein